MAWSSDVLVLCFGGLCFLFLKPGNSRRSLIEKEKKKRKLRDLDIEELKNGIQDLTAKQEDLQVDLTAKQEDLQVKGCDDGEKLKLDYNELREYFPI